MMREDQNENLNLSNINRIEDASLFIKKPNIKMNCEEYDNFLVTVKEDRFYRVPSPWRSFRQPILHKCSDIECRRMWRCSPAKVVEEDLHCNFCVQHNNNNMDRFEKPRLKWTGDVPNTFYVYKLKDPKDNSQLVKFGRTRHVNPNRRYPKEKRIRCKFNLIFSLRGKLRTMTKIENWWKDEAKNYDLFTTFSDKNFGGHTEIIKYDEEVLLKFIKESQRIFQYN